MADIEKLQRISKLVRYYILRMTTEAGSGHATSSLSAVDLMVALFFNSLRFDLENQDNPYNDRVIFSKGHVSPLVYALYAAAGVISEKELLEYRQFGSVLEGHPTPNFKYAEVATGSLGQGLSIGVGMVLALRAQVQSSKFKVQNLPKVYVLMGDSETAEGSVWEAVEIASYYKLGNLVAIVDVNRLGQRGETMLGWGLETYRRRFEAFGWRAEIVDGHNMSKVVNVFEAACEKNDKPLAIIAKTIKGKGVSFLENKDGWHGKALPQEDFEKAVKELGDVDRLVRGDIRLPFQHARGPVSSFPPASAPQPFSSRVDNPNRDLKSKKGWVRAVGNPSRTATPRLRLSYKKGEMVATRKAYGEALAKLGEINPNVVSLDAEVGNSTFAEIFAQKFPSRYFEMFIAEQNMVGAALGLSKRGKVPFVSTFGAFFTRAFDQIRMSAISRGNIKFVGSHTGVSIGEDGPSQMGLEDIAMFRSIFGSVVLCPGDAVACAKLVELAAENEGIFYIRTNRPATPVFYDQNEEFKIGGSKILRSSKEDRLTIVSCGVTLNEATKAADLLLREKIKVRIIDAYSIKPIDESTLRTSAYQTDGLIMTVEDHYFDGGLGDAVLNVFAGERFSHPRGEVKVTPGVHPGGVRVYKLAVGKLPRSGKSEELLDYEGISAYAIVKKVVEILK